MKKPPFVESRENRFAEYAWITVAFLVVLFAGLLALRGYFNAQEEKNFKSRVTPLVLAGENLIALAERGVDPAEFRNLLDEVKRQYDAAGAWPLPYTGANYEYVQALAGWSLAAEVWDAKAEGGSEYSYQERIDLEGVSAYLGIGLSKIRYFTAGDLIRQLLFTSAEHARKGKGLLGY